MDEKAHVTFPRTGTTEGEAISDRVGYGVSAWTVDGVEYTKTNGFKALTTNSDKTVVASAYTPYKYDIKFADASGTVLKTIKAVDYDTTLTETQLNSVTAPDITGKYFVGWTYNSKLYTNEEVLAMKVPGAVTFTATYENKSLVVFKDADDGIYNTEYVVPGDTATAPADPEKEGHTFSGWTDGTNTYTKEQIDAMTVTADVTYTAVWTAHIHTVIFKDGDTILSETEVAWGETPTAPSVDASEGKAFVGWSDGNATYFAADFVAGEGAYTVKGDVTFTAVWGDVVTVTFIDKNYTSDTGNNIWATAVTGKGGTVTVPATPANYAGMAFMGWSDGTNTYSEAELATLIINQDTTFTAIYTDKTFKVTFRNNDGSFCDEVIVYGENNCVTFPANPAKVTPDGIPSSCFEFAGWTYNGEIWDPARPVSVDGIVLVASYRFDEENSADVIGISTSDQLKSIAAGKIYVLTADITVDAWSAALPSNNVILDGDGHTITFIAQMKVPMFAETTAGNNFAIHNLTIKDAISASGQVILIANFKGNEMTVTNCHILNCTVTNQWGGAFACDVGGTVLFENCTVTGTMNQTGKGNMGGFVGSPLDKVTSDITFRNCKSVVTFNVTKTVGDGVGGIIGTANKKYETRITFEDCISDCTIAIVDSLNTSTTAQKIGGFIGTIYNKSTNSNTAIIITGGQSNCKMGDTTYAVNGSVGARSTVTITDLNQNGTDINPTTEE